jgi:hypothetical protein
MKQVQSPSRVVTQQETDQKMLEWLRDRLSNFSEDGYARRYSDSILARFAELIESQATFKRTLGTIDDAHKLAMAQMQFAQSVVKQLERHVETLERIEHTNGKSVPAIDLKGQ